MTSVQAKSKQKSTMWSERQFWRFERELGPCADKVGITREIFRRPDVEYSVESHLKMLDCASRSGYPHIGHTVGSTIGLSDMGAVGHSLRVSPTVGYALDLAARFSSVFSHGCMVRVDVGQDVFMLSYELTDIHECIPVQDVELAISLFANVVRELSGLHVKPLKVEFEHSAPEYRDILQSYFGCEVVFNSLTNQLHFSHEVVNLPVSTADSSLLEALEFYLAEQLKIRREDDLLGQAKYLITTSLRDGPPNMEAIAKTLGLSKRTLQRKLLETGSSFNELVDDIRRNRAIEYVKHSELSFTTVAHKLGYGELSAFSRAYHRWTGDYPQKSRNTPD